MLTSCWLKSVKSYFFTNLSTDIINLSEFISYVYPSSYGSSIFRPITPPHPRHPSAIRADGARPLKRIGMENFIEAMPTWNKLEFSLDDFCWMIWMLDNVGLALAAKKMCQFFLFRYLSDMHFVLKQKRCELTSWETRMHFSAQV